MNPAVPTIAVLLLLASHVFADSLDNVVNCGVKFYAESQPPAGEWAKQLFSELKADEDQAQTIPLSGLKFWMISAQRQDGDPNRPERIGTLAHTMATCAAAQPDEPFNAGDLIAKAEALLLTMYPPAPTIDPKSLIEFQKHRESVAIFRSRRAAAMQIVMEDFSDLPVERQKEIYLAAVNLLRSEIE